MNHNKLMAAEQVADLLGVGVHRVYELSRLNILPHIRLGRQLNIRRNRFRTLSRTAARPCLAAGGAKHKNKPGWAGRAVKGGDLIAYC